MKSKLLRLCLLTAFSVLSISSWAQNSREYIRSAIKEWDECRNVALTKTGGDLALYGKNGYATTGCPEGLNSAIEELRESDEYIDDIQLTDEGRYVILYGDNGLVYNDIPKSLERKLLEFNEAGEIITSVTFNDDGDWIVISTDHISSSSEEVDEWIQEGIEEYGQLWAACITDDACVLVFEAGYKFTGEVPADLKNALNESGLDVYRLKISGTAWFFADKSGNYRYNM